MNSRLAILALVLAGACAPEHKPLGYGDPRLPAGATDSESGPPGAFHNGVVTATSAAAAEAGSRVLAAGGNAIDAAAVVQFMLNVVEPQSSGLGGGGFILVYIADDDQTYFIDASERAPAAADPDMFVGQHAADVRSSSGYIVGVPGTLKGIATMLDRWGTIRLADAVRPAQKAAEQGVRVEALLAEESHSRRLDHELGNPKYDEARAVFRPHDKPLKKGDRLVQRDLARALQQIGERGARAFYDCGDSSGIAQSIIHTQRATRAINPGGVGRMTCEDLARYDVVLRPPLVGTYRDYTVITAPPPSAGGVALLQMLGMLGRFPIGGEEFREEDAQTLQVMQEAMRLAYADRALWLGDPDAVHLPIAGLLAHGYIEQRAQLIALGMRKPELLAGDPRAFDPTMSATGMIAEVPGGPRSREGHTTHFNVVDGHGNIVSYTSTISSEWGSGLMVRGYGFMLNDALANFNHRPTRSTDPQALDPGANDPAANKRPLSNMAPTMLLAEGRPIAAYGAAGGSTIISTLLSLTLGLVDQQLTVSQAIAAPRFTIESGSPDAVTSVEPGFGLKAIEALRRLGYSFDLVDKLGAAQAVITFPATGESYGAADPRRVGGVAGPRR